MTIGSDSFSVSIVEKRSSAHTLDFETDSRKKSNSSKLTDYINSVNVCEFLDDTELKKIAEACIKGFQEDKDSMSEWMNTADLAMDLAKLKREEKNSPWRKSANIKFPLISTCVVQNAARAESEMVRNGQVFKHKIIGRDNGIVDIKTGQLKYQPGYKNRKGQRVCMHLNYQVQEKIPHWHTSRDQLHHQLATIGSAFTKTYFDEIEGMIKSDFIPYDCIYVNNNIIDIHEAPRITQCLEYSDSKILENQRWGLFRDDLDFTHWTKDAEDSKAIYHDVLEMHTTLVFKDVDLYFPVPVIVTIHKAAKEVLRIVLRCEEKDVLYDKRGRIKKIYPSQYYTSYTFIPDPAGRFFGFGFGTLLLHVNETVNTILNCLINAGYASTAQGGFVSSDLRLESENKEVEPTEWLPVEGMPGVALKDAFLPFNYKEPSQVLFALCQYLIESGRMLAATSDAMTGQPQDGQMQNVSPNTVAQLLSEGVKLRSAIQKRVFRAFRREGEKIIKLNSKYLNVQEYLALVDPTPNELKEMFNEYGQMTDYMLESIDIVPVVDNSDATQTEILARTQAEMSIGAQLLQLTPNQPAINPRVLARNAFTALETPNVDQLVSPEPDPNAPNPQLIKLQHDMQMDQQKNQIEAHKANIKGAELESLSKEREAKAVKMYSDASVQHNQHNLDVLSTHLEHQTNQTQSAIDLHKANLSFISDTNAAKAKAAGSANGQNGSGQAPAAAQPDTTLADAHQQINEAATPQSQTDNTMSAKPKGNKGSKHSTISKQELAGLIKHHSPKTVAAEARARGWAAPQMNPDSNQ